MPERWERELGKLRELEPSEPTVRRRAGVEPREAGLPPRRERAIAGVVAGIVAVAALALVARTLPGGPAGVGSADLPTLTVSFHDGQVVPEGPDASYRRVETSIAYGDALEESFTSTTSEDAIVDWVAVEDLTRFVPGPTVGSLVRFEADGEDPRVLLGRPDDWPNFGRMEPVDRLPDEPGEYLLVFAADYPEGIARTARLVELVAPATLQVALRESEPERSTSADAFVDGRSAEGFLSSRSFTAGDLGMQSEPLRPTFAEDAWLPVHTGADLSLASAVTEARAGWFRTYDDFRWDHPALPIDPTAGGTVAVEPGRTLLAVEAVWTHGKTGYANDGTEERVVFFFPIEVVAPAGEAEPTPTVEPSPSPEVAGSVVIDIRRSPETVSGDPTATATFRDQQVRMCPEGWTLVNEDGTTESVVFNCGQGPDLSVPAGMPIVVTGDALTVEATSRIRGEQESRPPDVVPALEPGAVVTLGYEVTWDDGSEASFRLSVTVAGEPGADDHGILVRIFGLGERSDDAPVITMSYRGETRRGCTEAFRWTLADGTKVDEASGRHGSILPQCSYDPLFVVPPGVPITLEVLTATEVFATRTTTPFYEGRNGFGASVRWTDGQGDFTVSFEVEGEPGAPQIVLDCPQDEQVEFATPDGPRIQPGGSAYIRGNMGGFLQTDVIEQMTRDPGGSTGWDGVWQVVRAGSVIAAVDFSSLGGVACRGSGVGGV